MIKIENKSVYGFEAAIRGMRNPMNSWDRSDSYHDYDSISFELCGDSFVEGQNDLALMRKLAHAGDDHGKFARFINVTVDITAPLYWWKEMDTYRIGTVSNSCSTMHKIHDKEFTLDDFSHEHLTALSPLYSSMMRLERTIILLNFWRERYVESDEERADYFSKQGFSEAPSKKDCWWQIIQLLPASYNQRRTVQLNYQVLSRIYHARKNHKLDEWREFCAWIEKLPHFAEIYLEEGDNNND